MKAATSTLILLLSFPLPCWAENVLFVGNSYTIGSRQDPIAEAGGVPKYVEEIAASKGKTLATKTVATRSKDLAYHLQQPSTEDALKAEKWNWIVLQELSTKPTRVGNAEGFFEDAVQFYQRARAGSPDAKVLLYQTWPRPASSTYINTNGKPSSKKFENPEEMLYEVVDNYAEAARRIEALDPGQQVAIARVGEAFTQCVAKYPHLSLYAKDSHHASSEGYYLASLVIYGALFNDSPVGATHELPGLGIDAETARSLQEIAAAVMSEKPATSPAPADDR